MRLPNTSQKRHVVRRLAYNRVEPLRQYPGLGKKRGISGKWDRVGAVMREDQDRQAGLHRKAKACGRQPETLDGLPAP